MSAIRYLDKVPRLPGTPVNVLVDAQYADDGRAIYEHYEQIRPLGAIDTEALDAILGEAVWVGEGSPWELPEAWTSGVEFWPTGETSFDGSSPLEVNRGLFFTIDRGLPWYPTWSEIREHLAGKQLAIVGRKGDITHADVLVACAAGRRWRP